jgi:hypothetical protein
MRVISGWSQCIYRAQNANASRLPVRHHCKNPDPTHPRADTHTHNAQIAWATISATKGGTTSGDLYVVAPVGGGKLYISGVGFDTLEQTLGSWNPDMVACVFTPSADDENVTYASTEVVDGVIKGSRMLSCTIPPIAAGATANVTFEWGDGAPVKKFARSHGTNTLYSASWFTGIELVQGHPTITGIGFSPTGDYACLFFLPGAKDQSDMTTAVFVSTTELRCNVDLDPEAPILVAYNGNPKTTVIVLPQVGKDGKNYKDLENDQPANIPFETGFSVGKSLQYAYIETACGDGVKADNEIGVDCGLEACGKKCQWPGDQGALEIDAACDAHADCESENCDPTDGVCINAFYSCHEVKEANSNAKDGYYTISVDSNWRDWSKVVPDGTVEVLCHFYDGKAFALYEIVCSLVNDRGATFAFWIACTTAMVVLIYFALQMFNHKLPTFGGCGASVRVRVCVCV